MFVSILLMIRFVNRQTQYADSNLASNQTVVELLGKSFESVSILPFDPVLGGNLFVDKEQHELGYVLQTSPASDHVIGYSGPTNCLVTMSMDHKIQSIAILSSGDTIEHVDELKRTPEFFESFEGLGFESSDRLQQIDAVSGATLTSYAVIASVANRLGGKAPSLKFKGQANLKNVAKLFPAAEKLLPGDGVGLWNVIVGDKIIGSVLSSTPTADHLAGYQGPTAMLVGFSEQKECIGLVVDRTYENQPYANYLNDDYGFLNFFLARL